MSVNVKLLIEGKTINVLHSKYGFRQGSDENGYPCEKTRFLGLELLIEASKDADFFDWSTQSNLMKQLELHYVPRIMGGKTRKLSFIDCHCLEHETHFDAHSDKPMTERLFISAAGVKTSYSTEEYSAYWRKTFDDQGEETVREEEQEPELIETYYTDLKGNKILKNKLKRGQKVYFVIKTKNASGKELSIDLNNNKLDFEYGDEVLEEDVLTVNITSDTMKLELKTIAQQN